MTDSKIYILRMPRMFKDSFLVLCFTTVIPESTSHSLRLVSRNITKELSSLSTAQPKSGSAHTTQFLPSDQRTSIFRHKQPLSDSLSLDLARLGALLNCQTWSLEIHTRNKYSRTSRPKAQGNCHKYKHSYKSRTR